MKRDQLVKHHSQTITELTTQVARMSHDVLTKQLDVQIGKVKNVHTIKTIKQDIARLKTIIRQKELAGETQKPASVKPTPKTTTPKASTKAESNSKIQAKEKPAEKAKK